MLVKGPHLVLQSAPHRSVEGQLIPSQGIFWVTRGRWKPTLRHSGDGDSSRGTQPESSDSPPSPRSSAAPVNPGRAGWMSDACAPMPGVATHGEKGTISARLWGVVQYGGEGTRLGARSPATSELGDFGQITLVPHSLMSHLENGEMEK